MSLINVSATLIALIVMHLATVALTATHLVRQYCHRRHIWYDDILAALAACGGWFTVGCLLSMGSWFTLKHNLNLNDHTSLSCTGLQTQRISYAISVILFCDMVCLYPPKSVLNVSQTSHRASRACLVMTTGHAIRKFALRVLARLFLLSSILINIGITYTILAIFLCAKDPTCPDVEPCFCVLEPKLVLCALISKCIQHSTYYQAS